jgi:putative transposase
VIRHSVWLYLRFTLSYRYVEELLAERGLDVSYETVRRWVLKFGPAFARNLRRLRPRPSTQWHLDEMAVVIGGRRLWLWRAVDSEGEVLDILVQPRRDRRAALEAGWEAPNQPDCLVELRGFEPLTSAVRLQRSPI